MAMSDYLEGELINHVLRASSYTKPAIAAVALVLSPVVDSDTGLTIDEVPNSNNYSRQTINPSNSNWTSPGSDGTTANAVAVTFPVASGNWGTIVGIALVDSTTYGEGNILFYGNLSSSRTILSGDIFIISIGNLTITLS